MSFLRPHLSKTLLFFFFLSYLFLPTSVFAASCPVADGDDGSTDGIVTISANTMWSADASNQGNFDCSSLSLKVTNSATLTLASYDSGDTNYDNDYGVSLSFIDITVDSGANISGNYRGYAGGSGNDVDGRGPGYGDGGNFTKGKGASHGGRGAGSTDRRYDDAFTAFSLGSGGGGGYGDGTDTGCTGGGAIKLIATGTTTINGTVSANGGGGATNGGGGSGGSIYISTVDLAGTGSFSAIGGSPYYAGGGGRIAVYFSGDSDSSKGFGGTINVSGGTGSSGSGLPGTAIVQNSTTGDLYILTSQQWDVKTGREESEHTFGNLLVDNNSTWTLEGYYTTESDGVGFVFTVNDFTLESGSIITATGQGYAGGSGNNVDGHGPGGGSGANYGKGAGGGYGGTGGNSSDGGSGGSTYGSESNPVDLGSGGGGGYLDPESGASGGGAIKVVASGDITIDGGIYARGGSSTNGGGGSGGSIYFSADTISGSGEIYANGGSSTNGAGGGGGRVALHYAANSLTNTPNVDKGSSGGGGQAADGTYQTYGLPVDPSSLTQYQSDGSTEISVGEDLNSTSGVVKMSMSDADSSDTLTPEVEIREVGTSFTDSATHTGSGVSYSGSVVTGSVTIDGLSDLTNYHWQARVCDADSICSSWVSYGGNAESATDLTIVLNTAPSTPSSLGGNSLVDGSSTYDSTPTFSFTISDPDDADQVKYQIQIDDSSDFSSPVVDYTSTFDDEGSFSFTVGQAAGSGSYTAGSVNQTLSSASYYWRVKASDDDSASSDWSTANSGDIAFIVDISAPSDLVLDSPGGDSYINTSRPTFRWKQATATTAPISSYSFSLDNGEKGDISVSDIPTSGDYSTNTYSVDYDGDYISLTLHSHSSWSNDQSDGQVKEGRRSWSVTATNAASTSITSSRTLYLDTSSPSLSLSTSYSSSSLTLSGSLSDTRTGSHSDGYSDYARSNPDKIEVSLDRDTLLGGRTNVASVTLNFDSASCSISGDHDATQTCTFDYTLNQDFGNQDLYLTVTGRDYAGNSTSQSETLSLTPIVTPTPTPTPTPTSTPTPTPSTTPTQEQEDSLTSSSPETTPTPTPAPVTVTFKKVSEGTTKVVQAVAKSVGQVAKAVVVDAPKAIVKATVQVAQTVSQGISQGVKTIAQIFKSPIAPAPDLVDTEPVIEDIVEDTAIAQVGQRLQLAFNVLFSREKTTISNIKINSISPDSATITWRTNHPADSKINYGTSTSFELGDTYSSKLTKRHSLTITDLPADTFLYFEVISSGKNTVYDAYHTFRTLP